MTRIVLVEPQHPGNIGAVARIMANLVKDLIPSLGYIISKGGITTQTLLADGLDLSSVYLHGQLLAGVSVVTPYRSFSDYKVPIITFPGNLGDQDTLSTVWKIMETSH